MTGGLASGIAEWRQMVNGYVHGGAAAVHQVLLQSRPALRLIQYSCTPLLFWNDHDILIDMVIQQISQRDFQHISDFFQGIYGDIHLSVFVIAEI